MNTITIKSPVSGSSKESKFFTVSGIVSIEQDDRSCYVECSIYDGDILLAVATSVILKSKAPRKTEWIVDFSFPNLNYKNLNLTASLFFEKEDVPSVTTFVSGINLVRNTEIVPRAKKGQGSSGKFDGQRFGAGTSSCSSSSCHVQVTLVGDCKFEYTGLVYAIGTQNVNVSVSDPCGCVGSVKINGSTPPVLVNDGDEITIAVAFNSSSSCFLNSSSGPTCVNAMMMTKTVNGKRKTFWRMNAVGARAATVRKSVSSRQGQQTSSRSARPRVADNNTGSKS